MVTNSTYTLDFKNYGEITVPKGTPVTHQTAMGIDKNYHFVHCYKWIDENYPSIKNILRHDVHYYGINVPKELIDYTK